MKKIYLTKEADHELTEEYWNDPSTEDMTYGEFLRWKGWRYDITKDAWWKEAA